jgi:hypothetical protein
MNQKKHLNAIAALEASKDAEPGSYWDGDWCQGFDCARCYADKICELYADTKTRRAALQSGLDAYHKRKAEKAEQLRGETITSMQPASADPAPLIPDPPDTLEVRVIMEHFACEADYYSPTCPRGGCDGCVFDNYKCQNTAIDRQARHDFALSWLSRHPAVWDAKKGPYPVLLVTSSDEIIFAKFHDDNDNRRLATLSDVLPLIFDGPRQFADEARRQGWKR